MIRPLHWLRDRLRRTRPAPPLVLGLLDAGFDPDAVIVEYGARPPTELVYVREWVALNAALQVVALRQDLDTMAKFP